jgi:hypothetical protein
MYLGVPKKRAAASARRPNASSPKALGRSGICREFAHGASAPAAAASEELRSRFGADASVEVRSFVQRSFLQNGLAHALLDKGFALLDRLDIQGAVEVYEELRGDEVRRCDRARAEVVVGKMPLDVALYLFTQLHRPWERIAETVFLGVKAANELDDALADMRIVLADIAVRETVGNLA